MRRASPNTCGVRFLLSRYSRSTVSGHKALKGNTPYYRMFGKQAGLSFLRVIGARAFVHVEGDTTKLQPKAWEEVLVGYNNDSPSFHVYNRKTRRITSSRNVTFIEEPQVLLPAADASGDPDFDVEAEPHSTR